MRIRVRVGLRVKRGARDGAQPAAVTVRPLARVAVVVGVPRERCAHAVPRDHRSHAREYRAPARAAAIATRRTIAARRTAATAAAAAAAGQFGRRAQQRVDEGVRLRHKVGERFPRRGRRVDPGDLVASRLHGEPPAERVARRSHGGGLQPPLGPRRLDRTAEREATGAPEEAVEEHVVARAQRIGDCAEGGLSSPPGAAVPCELSDRRLGAGGVGCEQWRRLRLRWHAPVLHLVVEDLRPAGPVGQIQLPRQRKPFFEPVQALASLTRVAQPLARHVRAHRGQPSVQRCGRRRHWPAADQRVRDACVARAWRVRGGARRQQRVLLARCANMSKYGAANPAD